MDPVPAAEKQMGQVRASTRAYGQGAHTRTSSGRGTADMAGFAGAVQPVSWGDPAAGAAGAASGPKSGLAAAAPVSTTSRARDRSPAGYESALGHRKPQKRTSIGPWDFVKSIGAGSMGQVKLAVNRYTKQPAAIKIVAKAAMQTTGSSSESNEAKDARVLREAAVGKLVNHPNISQLYEIYSMSSHYYLVFEYIAGGQLLDYIITHGSVKEVQARRIAREIASALDYCHRHSIVHRDLKIENILITENGSIKIIDFGLANLFRRDSLLKTFCGSLYFAAPELLSAMPYVGPEIDVWSFGVVIYVLVCGKVPFEDKSMTVLHSKIKRGVVDYPTWLSPLCTDLLSRMLVVSPSERATMREVLHHPWMNKGYDQVPSPHVTPRFPLEAPVEPSVIQEMVSLRFGDESAIQSDLESVLASQPYRDAVIRWHESQAEAAPAFAATKEIPFRAADPLNSFHPLISMYILTRERLQKQGLLPKKDVATVPTLQLEAAGDISSSENGTRILSFADTQPASPKNVPVLSHAAPLSVVTNSSRRVVTSPVTPTEIRMEPQSAQTFTSPLKEVDAIPVIPVAPAAVRTRSRTVGEYDTTNMASLRLDPRYEHRAGTELSADLEDTPQSAYPANDGGSAERKTQLGSFFRRLSLRRKTNRSDASGPGSSHSSLARKSSGDINGSPIAKGKVELPDFVYPPLNQIPGTAPAAPKPLSRHSSARRRPASPAQNMSIPSAQGPIEQTSEQESVRKNSRLTASNRGHFRARSQGYQYYMGEHANNHHSPADNMPSIEAPKPVFFKGFFSVQSTSTKSLTQVRAEIIRVLTELGVDFVEIRGGFSCIQGATPSSVSHSDSQQTSISRVQSFLSPSPAGRHRRMPSRGRGSSSSSPRDGFDLYSSSSDSVEIGGSDMLGNSVSQIPTPVRFEITIVRVPLLALHGVQFKKISGNVWVYKTLAQEILKNLHL